MNPKSKIHNLKSTALFLLLFPAVAVAQGPGAKELTATPRFNTKGRAPQYAQLTEEKLRDAIAVAPGRGHAVFGYNRPEVQVYLPAADNSIAAEVTFGDVKLFDKGRKEIPFEIENGIFDFDSWSNEIRFSPKSGDGLVEFARAVGTATVHYPIVIKTVSVKRGKPAPAGTSVAFDGPFVTYDQNPAIPTMQSFSPISAVRAYDAAGKELARHDYRETSSIDGVDKTRLAFWGNVAEVQIDMVEKWSDISIQYDLPPAPKLPHGREGLEPPGGRKPATVAGAKVEKTIVAAAPAAATETFPGGYSTARETLEAYGRKIDEQSMYEAALEGEEFFIKLLLKAGIPATAKNGRGDTPVVVAAAQKGYLTIAKMLIEEGADVNAADSNSVTVLFEAVEYCDETDFVKWLIQRGANVNVKVASGTSVLQNATWAKCDAIIKALKAAGAK